jgi:alpha-amylase/alpha-mannosidase (GH57 family)
MYWANFLHLYQPADQQPDILEAVVNQSYAPLINGLKKYPNVRITLNVTGALLELFDRNGYQQLLGDLKELGETGNIEFTGSAKYHAFLPMVKEDEIARQIEANNETAAKYLGNAYAPKGFFPPEMGYDPKILPVLEKFGFEWVLLDEIAHSGGVNGVDYSKIHEIEGSKLKVFFRERRISNLIMSAVVRSSETLKESLQEELRSNRYILTAMDGETFGHHRPGLENMLFDVFDSPEFDLVSISELPSHFDSVSSVSPVRSTWASSKQDIERGVQFLSWKDPDNEIHNWQWQLLHLVINEVYKLNKDSKDYDKVRNSMDRALASDHFWWASAKPWWSVEMIEDGAHRLLQTMSMIPDVPYDKTQEAYGLYQKIVSTAFNWQRTGKIRQMAKEQNTILRIPFKDRTVGAGGAEEGVYRAFIAMIEDLEKKAAATGEYEKAILWRDAIFKLESKLDIYDMINAVDLVRQEIPHKEVEEMIEKYKARYREIRGGQPEQRGA